MQQSLERPLSRQDENVDSHWMPRSIGGAERRLASDSDKNPFAFCPIDIVREIFEIAARNATADACTLSLVSRDTRQWVNPFLYQTLVITKPGHIEAIITNSLSLPGSSQFLAQHVHYLAFVWAENSTISMWDDEVIQGIAWLLRACKNIRSLLADFFHLQRVTNLMVTLPHLRRIHCLDAKPSLSKLGEAEITHLYVRVAPPWDLYTYAHIDEWAIPLRLPPRVSHLGFHIRISLDGDAWPSMLLSFVSHILESSNISRLVITLTFFDHEDRRRLLVPESHPFTDPRLCLLLNGFGGTQRADVARDWETEARGGRGVWDRESEGKPGAIIEV